MPKGSEPRQAITALGLPRAATPWLQGVFSVLTSVSSKQALRKSGLRKIVSAMSTRVRPLAKDVEKRKSITVSSVTNSSVADLTSTLRLEEQLVYQCRGKHNWSLEEALDLVPRPGRLLSAVPSSSASGLLQPHGALTAAPSESG